MMVKGDRRVTPDVELQVALGIIDGAAAAIGKATKAKAAAEALLTELGKE